MAEPKRIVSHHYGEYGRVKVKLAELLEARGVTRNRRGIRSGGLKPAAAPLK